MICEDCEIEMVEIKSVSGHQSNGCDVDISVYECPCCKKQDSE